MKIERLPNGQIQVYREPEIVSEEQVEKMIYDLTRELDLLDGQISQKGVEILTLQESKKILEDKVVSIEKDIENLKNTLTGKYAIPSRKI